MAQQSALLILPPELRNRIYEYVFSIVGPGETLRLRHANQRHPFYNTVLSFLETCRQIHAEAEDLFYHYNHIYLEWDALDITLIQQGVVVCEAFQRSLTDKRRNALRAITVGTTWAEDMVLALKTFRSCKRLDTLHFRYLHSYANTIREDLGKEYFRFTKVLPALSHIKDFRLLIREEDKPSQLLRDELAAWEEKLMARLWSKLSASQ